ncbi:MAG: hypothetical protein RLY71_691 [Pseudomonadota bacterium]|jgi:hypothetical protein
MMQAVESVPPSDLAQLERDIWEELALAVRQRTHGWRHMALATRSEDGWPDVRTVVLRECQVEERRLLIYTDARSVKVRQLQADDRATLVAWSADLGWQLRLRCRIQVLTEGLSVASRWARIRLTPAAQDYLFPLPPGADLSDHVPEDDQEGWLDSGLATDLPPHHPDTVAHHYFAVLEIQVQSIDWLALTPQGHRRARFDAPGCGRWLAP